MVQNTETEKIWSDLASSLTLYFIYGDINSYNNFEKIFNKHFENDVDEEKFIKMVDRFGGIEVVKKNGGLSPNEYIKKLFDERRMFNSDYERELQTVLSGCKYCYKLLDISSI